MHGNIRITGGRRAFTLIEVALSSMIVSTLMIAMASAVVLASRAIPRSDSPGIAAAEQSRAFEILSADLAEALYFNERTATSLGFTVPDRDGDGNPEHLRYAWGGSAGDPLTRALNADSPTELIVSLDSLAFVSKLAVTAAEFSGVPIEGSEQLVKVHDVTQLSGYTVTVLSPVGESFLPDLPMNTIAWRLTTVEPYISAHGSPSGTLSVRLQGTLASAIPDSVVLHEVHVPESTLPSGVYDWHPIPFGANYLDPARRYAITFHDAGDGKPAMISNDRGLPARPGQALVLSSGGSWSVVVDESLVYRIYGVPMYAASPISFSRNRVTSVGVDLAAGGSFSSEARCLNAPEVLDGYWSLDFSKDPTTVDIDANGVGDWVVKNGAAFDAGSISGGVWTATQEIESTPRGALATPVTVDVRLRDATMNDGKGAVVTLYIDHDGAWGARLRLTVLRTGLNEQQIELTSKPPQGGSVILHRSTVSTSAFMDIRISTLPASDTVNLQVDNKDLGSFRYYIYGTINQGRVTLSVKGGDRGSEFKQALVRVSPAP